MIPALAVCALKTYVPDRTLTLHLIGDCVFKTPSPARSQLFNISAFSSVTACLKAPFTDGYLALVMTDWRGVGGWLLMRRFNDGH